MRISMGLMAIAGLLCGAVTLASGSPAQDAAKLLGSPIATQVLAQKNSPLQIFDAAAFWKEAAGEPNAYWDAVVYVRNVSPKKIIGYEVRIAFYNAFGERLTSYRGVGNKDLIPGAESEGVYEDVNINYAGGKLVKVSVYRVKFSDGSVWVTK